MDKMRFRYLVVCYGMLVATFILLVYLGMSFSHRYLTKKRLLMTTCETLHIPRAAYVTLLYIKTYNKAPPSYKALSTFKNMGGLLSRQNNKNKPIHYFESDIYPDLKEVIRGPERLLIGSDNKSYYTYDHYEHTIEITEECQKYFIQNAHDYE
jgi:hypothetical protein